MLKIRVEPNGQVFDGYPCQLCGERFHLTDPQPELYDDGQQLGSVCKRCFKALQAGGAVTLVAYLQDAAQRCMTEARQREERILAHAGRIVGRDVPIAVDLGIDAQGIPF